MSSTGAAKRLTCATCARPQQTCICHWITPTAHEVEVVVLQHPLEVGNAKGSARLMHLSLSCSKMAVGEVFDERALQALLSAPFEPMNESPAQKQAILLYPHTTDDKASGESAAPIVTPELLCDPSRLRLVVLDGTWRKSRKMLYLNPLLQQLPRLSLKDLPASRYLIRKACRPDQLSTLEATCFALMQMEGDADRFQPLLRAFDGFVAQQLALRSTNETSLDWHPPRK